MAKVTFVKLHPNYAYYPGDEAELTADEAARLTKAGYVVAGNARFAETADARPEAEKAVGPQVVKSKGFDKHRD